MIQAPRARPDGGQKARRAGWLRIGLLWAIARVSRTRRLSRIRDRPGGAVREESRRRCRRRGCSACSCGRTGRGSPAPDLVGGVGGDCASGVVLEGSLEDRRVDQAEDVLAGAKRKPPRSVRLQAEPDLRSHTGERIGVP